MKQKLRTVPPFVGCNQTKVFRLCFGAFANTSTDTTFYLVRRTNGLVTLLQLDGDSNESESSAMMHD